MKPTPQLKVDTEQIAGCTARNLPVNAHAQHTYIPCAFYEKVSKDKMERQVPYRTVNSVELQVGAGMATEWPKGA